MYWTGLSPDEARQFLANKDKSKRDKRMSLKEAVQKYVKDGDNIGIGGFVNGRQPVATVFEIARQGRKDLTLSFQSAGLAIEYLAGAMALDESKNNIKRLELAYWAHEAFGISPLFRYLTENNKVELEDWSNYDMSARFKAGSMGLPFIPCRSPLGSDMLKTNRAKVIDCPFTERPIMLLPASHPDVALIHVQEADIYGNCRIQGPLYTCPEISMASAHTIVTCDRLIEHEDMTRYPNRVSIPFFSVDAVVEVPFGSYPGNCNGIHYFDEKHIPEFRTACEKFRKGDAGALQKYYEDYVFGVENFAQFIDKIPFEQLQYVQKIEPSTTLEAAFKVLE
ncbi:MAG: Acyl CoA:acetate/3-ketoacid CoA transferase, alpha subunit [Pelotomaculum thermopropionicum]|uniref:Acyl CoA:acetate/3-ketoacid CoA transferase, alpha subunit n=1 Tax=Pelotomaculum thermopropionicum TaxID=110500 RepID=A0A117M3Z0_9FIRM|nr:MAG: Acyl CoA:acetate/3-ketoacid CoA transferase, alpha subunit [Pelotomaculum thermopropionicum]